VTLDVLAVILVLEGVALVPSAVYLGGVYTASKRRARGPVPFLYSLIVALCVAIGIGGGVLAVVLVADLIKTPIRGDALLRGLALIPMLFTPIAVALAVRYVRNQEDDE